MSNGVFNFNLLALLLSEILGGPKFTLGGSTPPSGEIFDIRGSQIYTRGLHAPWTPPIGEIFLPKASTSQYLIVFLISTF